MVTTLVLVGLVSGVILMNGLESGARSKVMVPEWTPDPTWGASLFATAWANGAITGLGGSAVASGSVEGALVTGAAIAAYTWGWRLLVRQCVRESAGALRFGDRDRVEDGKADDEEPTWARATVGARQRLWERNLELRTLAERTSMATTAVAWIGMATGAATGWAWAGLAENPHGWTLAVGGIAVYAALAAGSEHVARERPGLAARRRQLEFEELATEGPRTCDGCGRIVGEEETLAYWDDATAALYGTCPRCTPSAEQEADGG